MLAVTVWQLSSCGGSFFEGQGPCEDHGCAYFPIKNEALEFLRDWAFDPVEVGETKFELAAVLLKAQGLRKLAAMCLDHEGFVSERKVVMTGTVVEFPNGKIGVKWEVSNV